MAGFSRRACGGRLYTVDLPKPLPRRLHAFQRAVIPDRGGPRKRLGLVPDNEGLKGVFFGYVPPAPDLAPGPGVK